MSGGFFFPAARVAPASQGFRHGLRSVRSANPGISFHPTGTNTMNAKLLAVAAAGLFALTACENTVQGARQDTAEAAAAADRAAAEAEVAAERAAAETRQAADRAAAETRQAADRAAAETRQAADQAAAATREAAADAAGAVKDAAARAEEAARN